MGTHLPMRWLFQPKEVTPTMSDNQVNRADGFDFYRKGQINTSDGAYDNVNVCERMLSLTCVKQARDLMTMWMHATLNPPAQKRSRANQFLVNLCYLVRVHSDTP